MIHCQVKSRSLLTIQKVWAKVIDKYNNHNTIYDFQFNSNSNVFLNCHHFQDIDRSHTMSDDRDLDLRKRP